MGKTPFGFIFNQKYHINGGLLQYACANFRPEGRLNAKKEALLRMKGFFFGDARIAIRQSRIRGSAGRRSEHADILMR